jgi:signal transduction histidine kinase
MEIMDTTIDTRARTRVTRPLEPQSYFEGPFSIRMWRELGYMLAALPWSIIGVAYIIVMMSLTVTVAVMVWGGAVVLAGSVMGARRLTNVDRRLARAGLRAQIDDPLPFQSVRGRGFWTRAWSMISDGVGWRAMGFMMIQFPLSFLTLTASLVLLVVPASAMTHWIWGGFVPSVVGADGELHGGTQFGDFVNGAPLRNVGLAFAGVLAMYIGAAAIRGMAHLHRMLAEALLGPTAASLRVASLELSRGRAVEGADATLRRIERDLHDGTQARLVSIAMQLGEAKEQAAIHDSSRELTALIDAAHASIKETLVELRELARGIHPPALDNGLAVALETLAARSPLPVQLKLDLHGHRPAEVIETIAYFCATELLTNAIKHSQATSMTIEVAAQGDSLRMEIRDDGVGGAVILVPDVEGHHSGLTGLAERVGSVDGQFAISSPAGGPTAVIVTLPLNV